MKMLHKFAVFLLACLTAIAAAWLFGFAAFEFASMAPSWLVFTSYLVLFSMIFVFSVVYNKAKFYWKDKLAKKEK